MPPPGAPAGLRPIAVAVDAVLRDVLDAEVARWRAVDEDLAEPLEALRDLVMAGGKRVRPAFCHLAFVGAGGEPADAAVVRAGAALELLHTFALVHDDVMDGSPLRRGMEAVHTRFVRRHAGEGWRGESRRFGEGVAILAGDLAFVYADVLLAGAPQAAISVFGELRLEVNVGQYLDLVNTARGRTPAARARRIVRYKTAKYTVERPLHLGAALAGRLEQLAGPLTAIGLPLGEAFQLRDDVLGVFGDDALTGKPVGDDLRAGKPTVLHAIAAERATGPAARLLDRLGADDLDADEVDRIREVLVATGARDEVERMVDELLEQAEQAIEVAPLARPAADALVDLARFLVRRDH